MKKAPNKSTLSYANAHRPWQMYQDLFYDTLGWCRSFTPGKHKFRFKNKLLSLDSTTVSLCLSLFPWAKFRKRKGAKGKWLETTKNLRLRIERQKTRHCRCSQRLFVSWFHRRAGSRLYRLQPVCLLDRKWCLFCYPLKG